VSRSERSCEQPLPYMVRNQVTPAPPKRPADIAATAADRTDVLEISGYYQRKAPYGERGLTSVIEQRFGEVGVRVIGRGADARAAAAALQVGKGEVRV
jgi:hypothetical protein